MERRSKDLRRLKRALGIRVDGKTLPPEYKDHPLRGEFAGSRDCHIEPDWILIYSLDQNHVRFERTGTHNDVFG
jgi:mRNA interferase YafQ